MGHSTARTSPARTRPVLLALLVAVALVVAACGSSTSSGSSSGNDGSAQDEATPVDGGSLVIGIPTETGGWNPATNQIADAGSLVISSILEPLAEIGPDSAAQPWLADSWSPNADFTSWTLRLHPSITFHDGTPFDAQAVVDCAPCYKPSPRAFR